MRCAELGMDDCDLAIKLRSTWADRKVDGGFNVHVHSSLSWSHSPCSRALAKGTGVSQPVAGQGSDERWRPDDPSHHQHASWAYAADAGARRGVPGDLTQILDGEGRP